MRTTVLLLLALAAPLVAGCSGGGGDSTAGAGSGACCVNDTSCQCGVDSPGPTCTSDGETKADSCDGTVATGCCHTFTQLGVEQCECVSPDLVTEDQCAAFISREGWADAEQVDHCPP